MNSRVFLRGVAVMPLKRGKGAVVTAAFAFAASLLDKDRLDPSPAPSHRLGEASTTSPSSMVQKCQVSPWRWHFRISSSFKLRRLDSNQEPPR